MWLSRLAVSATTLVVTVGGLAMAEDQAAPFAERSPADVVLRLTAEPSPAGPPLLVPPSEPDRIAEPATTPLSLEDLERIALQCNPTLMQARMAISAAEGQQVQAGLYPNPVAGYLVDEAGNDGTEGLQGAFVEQQIVTAGKLRLGRAVAGRQAEQARWGWVAQQLRVRNAVRGGYYEALLAQKMIEVEQELVRIGNESLEVTQRLREAQEVSKVDVLTTQIEAEQAKVRLQVARNRLRIAWRRLATVVGQPDMPRARLAGDVTEDLPQLDWQELLAQLLSQSPELARARTGVAQARYNLALQKAGSVPNIDVGAAVKYDTGSQYTVADVAIGMPLPLFNRNQGNIRSAEAALIAAKHELRRLELELRNRFAAAYEPYMNARYEAEAFAGQILPTARESLELIQLGYQEGEFDYLALLTAQRTFFNSNLEYLAALHRLWTQTVELEGLLLQGGLQPIE